MNKKKRHVKYPLNINGRLVRTLEDLRKYFESKSVLSYFDDGRLSEWLRDRYYDDLSERINKIDVNSNELIKQIAEILDIKSDVIEDVSIDEVREDSKHRKNVKSKISNTTIINNYTNVALNQMQFEEFLRDHDEIYLLDNEFKLPLLDRKVKLIGLNHAKLTVGMKEAQKCLEYGVVTENLDYDERKFKIIAYTELSKTEYDKVAFNQGEFEKLINNSDVETIYLSGKFSLDEEKVRYVKLISAKYAELTVKKHSAKWVSDCELNLNDVSVRSDKDFSGEIIEFGSLSLAPLRWTVMECRNNYVILLCNEPVYNSCVFINQYHITDHWEESNIYKWLNDKFLNIYFSETEKQLLCESINILNLDEFEKYKDLLPDRYFETENWLCKIDYDKVKENAKCYSTNAKTPALAALGGGALSFAEKFKQPGAELLSSEPKLVSVTDKKSVIPVIRIKRSYFDEIKAGEKQ